MKLREISRLNKWFRRNVVYTFSCPMMMMMMMMMLMMMMIIIIIHSLYSATLLKDPAALHNNGDIHILENSPKKARTLIG